MTILFGLIGVPEDAPQAVRDGLACRNVATRTGHCPGCGSTLELNRAQRRSLRRAMRRGGEVHAQFRHDDGCLAIAPATLAWMRRQQ